MLDKIYEFYTQYTKYAQEIDGQKHIKYCSSLASSESTRILINKQTTFDYLQLAQHSLRLAEYSFKFSLKIKNGLQLASDFVQNYHLHFLKYVQSIGETKSKEVKQELNEFHKNIIVILDKNEAKVKQYNEIVLLLVIHMFNFVYLNGFNECKSNLNEISKIFKPTTKEIPKKSLPLSKTIKTKNLYDQLVALFAKILEYSNMLKICPKSTTLKITSKLELQLENDFFSINLSSPQVTSNLILVFVQLVELLFNYNKNFLAESVCYSKFLQESLFSLFAKAVPLHTKLIQTLYNLQIDTNKENLLANNTDSDDEIIATENTSPCVDKSIKYLFYKPFNEYYSIEKMLEYHFKLVNGTNGTQSKLNMDLCERLLKSHLSYIDWLKSINAFSADEMWKFYHQLESNNKIFFF
jgi:hypothetical protein